MLPSDLSRRSYFGRNVSVNHSLHGLSIQHLWVSSLFGSRKLGGTKGFHAGIDLAAPRGTPVYAAEAGIIIEAAYSAGYGNYILIAHNRKFKTRYAHLDKILVHAGEKVCLVIALDA